MVYISISDIGHDSFLTRRDKYESRKIENTLAHYSVKVISILIVVSYQGADCDFCGVT